MFLGLVEKQHLKIIWKDYSEIQVMNILSLLEKFEIITKIPGNATSLSELEKLMIPSMIPEYNKETPLKIEQKEQTNLHKREYLIKFIPLGFFCRLISRLAHENQLEIVESWRNSILLKSSINHFEEALISNVSTSNQVYIYKITLTVSCLKEKSHFFVSIVNLIESVIENFFSKENRGKNIKRIILCDYCCAKDSLVKDPSKLLHQDLVDNFLKGNPSIICKNSHIVSINQIGKYKLLFKLFLF